MVPHWVRVGRIRILVGGGGGASGGAAASGGGGGAETRGGLGTTPWAIRRDGWKERRCRQ